MYLKAGSIRSNKVITSAWEEGARPSLELVRITPGEGGSSWPTFYLKHSEFRISMSGSSLKTTSPLSLLSTAETSNRETGLMHALDIFLQGGGGCGGNEFSVAEMWDKNEHFYISLEKLCYYSLVGQLLVTSFKIRKAHAMEHSNHTLRNLTCRDKDVYVRTCHSRYSAHRCTMS